MEWIPAGHILVETNDEGAAVDRERGQIARKLHIRGLTRGQLTLEVAPVPLLEDAVVKGRKQALFVLRKPPAPKSVLIKLGALAGHDRDIIGSRSPR
jgi:hypothetical protein